MNTYARIGLLSTLALLVPQCLFAATLSVAPATLTVQSGQEFTVSVLVSSADQALNAVSGTLTFPSDLLSVSSVSKTGSVLTLWVQDPTYSNAGGTVDFGGVVPNPGWTGTAGRVITIDFHAKSPGSATIAFSNASVLANDGAGTEILTGTTPARIQIAAPLPQPTPAPQEKAPPQSPKVAPPAPSSSPPSTESESATSSGTGVIATVEPDYTPWLLGLLLLLIIAAVIAALMINNRRLRVAVRHERHGNNIKSARLFVHRQFSELKDAIVAELRALEHTKTRSELTAEEEAFSARLKSMIAKTEAAIDEHIDSMA